MPVWFHSCGSECRTGADLQVWDGYRYYFHLKLLNHFTKHIFALELSLFIWIIMTEGGIGKIRHRQMISMPTKPMACMRSSRMLTVMRILMLTVLHTPQLCSRILTVPLLHRMCRINFLRITHSFSMLERLSTGLLILLFFLGGNERTLYPSLFCIWHKVMTRKYRQKWYYGHKVASQLPRHWPFYSGCLLSASCLTPKP